MKKPKISEHVNPNLIPMIDIMFLLLLFFMLGADMGHRELETVRLPQAKAATKDTQQDKEGRLTINANHKEQVSCSEYRYQTVCRNDAHWEIAFRGRNCTDPEVLAKALSDVEREGALSKRRVMIRADAGAPFGLAQRAMNVCASKGIFKLEMGAAKPKER
jgi:biopolymer transport protein ExbD